MTARALALPPFPRRVARVILLAVIAASGLALAWPSLPWSEPAPPGPTRVGVVLSVEGSASASLVGAVAPEITWAAPDGRTRRLSELRGKPVFLNFWATWCEPCREELPAFDRVARDGTATVLAIDLAEGGEKVRAFLDRYGLAAVDPILDLDSDVGRRYGIATIPSTVVVGADGTVRQVVVGQLSESAIRDWAARAR